MSRSDLSEAEWRLLKNLLPAERSRKAALADPEGQTLGRTLAQLASARA